MRPELLAAFRSFHASPIICTPSWSNVLVENAFVAWLQERFPPSPAAPLGLADDAAILLSDDGPPQVACTDMLMEGAHFHLQDAGAEAVGYKSLGVNLSDIAAMAAVPTAAFVSVAVPSENARGIAEGILQGMEPLLQQFDLQLAGGDTNVWKGPLVVSVTLTGRLTDRGPLTRRNGQPGDWLIVTGSVGGSLLGRHLAPQPRIQAVLTLHENFELHAAMDISDGLALDASRLAAASSCGLELELAHIPIHEDAYKIAARDPAARNPIDGDQPLQHALHDGEDFEIMLAVPPEAAAAMLSKQPLEIPLTKVGQFTQAEELWMIDADGSKKTYESHGYEHGV